MTSGWNDAWGGTPPNVGRSEPQGPGWWRASDGMFYPPHLHPDYVAPQQVPPTPPTLPAQPPMGPPPMTPSPWGAPDAGSPPTWGSPPAAAPTPPWASAIAPYGSSPPWTPGLAPPQPAPKKSRAPVVIVLSLLVLGAIIAAVAVATNRSSSSSTHSSATGSGKPRQVTTGRSVYHDDFHDPGSGWATLVAPLGTTFGYASGAYQIQTVPHHSAWARAPYQAPLPEVEVEATASISADAPHGAGFGASCLRTDDEGLAANLRYDLMIFTDGRGTIFRVTGTGESAKAVRLDEVSVDGSAGTSPQTVALSCSMTANSRIVQLVGRVGDHQFLDITDQPGTLPGSGWCGAVNVPSTTGSYSANFSRFDEHVASSH